VHTAAWCIVFAGYCLLCLNEHRLSVLSATTLQPCYEKHHESDCFLAASHGKDCGKCHPPVLQQRNCFLSNDCPFLFSFWCTVGNCSTVCASIGQQLEQVPHDFLKLNNCIQTTQCCNTLQHMVLCYAALAWCSNLLFSSNPKVVAFVQNPLD